MGLGRYLFILAFGIFVASGCDDEDIKETDTIRLGAMYCTTGAQSGLDLPSSRGAALAVAEINGNGGVDGRNVSLIIRNGESDTSIVREQTLDILEEAPDVTAFLGLSDTDMALASAPVARDAGKVFVTSGATSPRLPGQVPGYLYLACFGDNVQAAASAEWAYQDLQARTATVLFDSTSTFTILLHQYFIERFESLGGQVVLIRGYDPSIMTGLENNIPQSDIIFLGAEVASQGGPIIQQFRQAGITAPVLGGDGFDSGEVWSGLGDITDVYFTTHAYLGADNPNTKVQAFRDSYLNAYGTYPPNAFAALGYDAVKIIAAAVEVSGSTDPNDVRIALGQLSNIQGVTGTISYENGKQIPQKSVTIMNVSNGVTSLVKEVIPEVIPDP